MKSYGNIVSQRENDSSLEIKLKVIDNCDIADREFKIAVMKKHKVLQENPERPFSEIRNKVSEQNEYFNKMIKTLRSK